MPTKARCGRMWGLMVATLLAAVLMPAAHAAAAPTADLAVQSVETSGWPRVAVHVVLPAEMLSAGELRVSDFLISENGADLMPSSVRSLAAARQPLHVVLVLDASGSMKGRALVQEKAAAVAFVDAMKPDDRVAVVSFDSQPRVVAAFTGDAPALRSAIDGVQASRETALYDALELASQQFVGVTGSEKAIVVLSDGADTVSAASADSAAKALSDAGTPAFAVAIRTKDYTPTALDAIARSSRGRLVSVTDPGGLPALFTGIAAQLQNPYEVVFTSLKPPAKDLEIDVLVSSRDLRADATAVVANPAFRAGVGTRPSIAASAPSPLWPPAIAGLTFLAVGVVVGGAGVLARPQRSTIDQLKFYEQLQGRGGTRDSDEAVVDPESARGRLMGVVGTVAARGGFDAMMRIELERAGLPLRPVEYIMLHVVSVLGAGMFAELLFHSVAVTGVAVLVLALGPIFGLAYLARRRTARFQDQLPDVLNMLAGSLRAGWGLLQAVGMVVTEMAPPAAPEFGRAVTEARLGIPLDEALEKMAERMNSEDFRWAVTAIAIQREVGGNLAEVLDLVAQTVRDRAGLRRQVSSLTSEGRLSALILIVLPFVEALALWLLNPDYFSKLLADPLGIGLTVAAGVLIVIGSIWLRRIVKIEV